MPEDWSYQPMLEKMDISLHLKGIESVDVYDVPIFAISSFNRENYTSPVNIASFKESGAIEYTSDVLMALQFKGKK